MKEGLDASCHSKSLGVEGPWEAPDLEPMLLQPGSGWAPVRVKCRLCSSDEDEVLYQKLSWEQWQLETLVDLLSHCQKSGLAGDFFLRCLQVRGCLCWEPGSRKHLTFQGG